MDKLLIVLAVLGPSQHGKSSFINFLSGLYSLKVGDDDGLSTTLEVQEVRAPDRFGLFQKGAELRFLDVPGFEDTDLRISNDEISESIRFRLVGMESRKLDVLFVFQSIADSTITLKSTFSRAQQMFGDAILQSIIVVLTKTDLKESVLQKRMKTVEETCRQEIIPYITWVNNSTESVIEEKQLKKQLAELKAALAKVKPYEMKLMKGYEEKVKQMAMEMMLIDPTNLIRQEVNVTNDVIYYETETYEFPVIKPKFTDAEVQQEAKRLQSLQENKESVPVNKQITETVVDYRSYYTRECRDRLAFFLIIPYEKTECFNVQKYEPINKQITKTVQVLEYRERPLEYFVDLLKKEVVSSVELRERLVQKKKQQTTVEISESYKRDWTHYRSQAAERLAREQWKQV